MKRTSQLTRERLISLMSKVPFLKGLNASEHSQIADYAQIYIAEKGEAIIEKEATDTCFYVLLTGSAKVALEREGKAVARLAPGEVFGEIGFILYSPRTTWVMAENRSVLLRVDQMLINSLNNSAREKLKDQIIIKLAKTIQAINESTIA